ncbi:hypothetical protein FRUB_07675 [Fimbriiglobus ruber]|uniref:Uncharacterized protein n=1 Tax=Fimbriiglobus ruber TaxID=1908690 RepID=A0A225DQB8_9BACT|nr:hypothetical protein FRUB_07675 [Fimbriiglobus ruber]
MTNFSTLLTPHFSLDPDYGGPRILCKSLVFPAFPHFRE